MRFRPVALALMAEADTQVFCLHRPRALEDLNKT
jgi:hypothetical protein